MSTKLRGAGVNLEQAREEAEDQVWGTSWPEAGVLCGRREHAGQGGVWSPASCAAAAPTSGLQGLGSCFAVDWASGLSLTATPDCKQDKWYKEKELQEQSRLVPDVSAFRLQRRLLQCWWPLPSDQLHSFSSVLDHAGIQDLCPLLANACWSAGLT